MTTTIDTTRRQEGAAETRNGIAAVSGSANGSRVVEGASHLDPDHPDSTVSWGNEYMNQFAAEQRAIGAGKREAAKLGRKSLRALVQVCGMKTGQSYHVRAMLYSLWNGKPASLLELLALDYPIRKQVLDVCAGFGWDGDSREPEFFYDAIKGEFERIGLFAWFIKEEAE